METRLKHMHQLVKKLRKLKVNVPLGQLDVLFTVASAGEAGTTLTKLSEDLDIGQGSCSRFLSALGAINRHHEPGLGLIQAAEDPLERRRKILTLTKKGQDYLKSLGEA